MKTLSTAGRIVWQMSLYGKTDFQKIKNKGYMADRPLALQRDPYGEKIELVKFDWRDQKVMSLVDKFVEFGKTDSMENITRQDAVKTRRLLRSIQWRTWNDCGGNRQVFEVKYRYYAKFVELALGKGMPFIGLPPAIAQRKWMPIDMPDGRKRRAKPSIPTELRKQAAKFTTMLEDRYSFYGIAMIVYALGPSIQNQELIHQLLFSSRFGRTLRVFN